MAARTCAPDASRSEYSRLLLVLLVIGLVRGLSDGYRVVPAPEGGKPTVQYKTLEIDLIFNAIADALPGLTLAGDPSRLRSAWINGVKHLQVQAG